MDECMPRWERQSGENAELSVVILSLMADWGGLICA